MRFTTLIQFLLASLFILIASSSFAQLHFEDFVFDGANGGALLNEASCVTVSPDGNYVYITSAGSNAINVYSKDSGSPQGELNFVELYKSGVDGVEGLISAQSIIISPDGRNAYAVGNADDALVSFQRNITDGTLTYMGMHKDGFAGVDGLDGAFEVIISPDGKHVYVSGMDDSAIAVFNRDAITGFLTFSEKIANGVNGISGLHIVFGIAISPDGKNLYAASHLENKLVAFSRDAITGSLTFVDAMTDDVGGVDGLNGSFSVFVSPDGNNVYATGAYDNAVSVFNRNASTGTLSFLNFYQDGTNGGTNLNFPIHITGSHDGDFIYVLGSNDNSLNTFTRNSLGELAFHESQTEGINGVAGINFPTNIAVSPNDNFVYTASSGSNAGVVFEKDLLGNLNFIQNKVSGGAGVDGLDDPYSIAVSPDGKHLYVASNDDDAVAIFSRNQNTGTINFIDMVVDGVDGTEGLLNASAVTVSPDGKHVYATGNNDDAVSVFSRDDITGELTFIEYFEDNENGVDGMNGARWVTVSPDGKNVYVVGYFDDAIAMFSRDVNTGTLTYMGHHEDGQNGVDGLKRANSVTISSDGLFAYATGFTDDAIAVFSRNPADGMLTYITNYKNGLTGITGLNGAHSVIVSHDGMNVYACGFNDGTVTAFSRNPVTGLLNFMTSYQDGVGGIDGLVGVRAVALNPDDQHFYAVSGGENAIVLFERDASTGELTYQMQQEDGVASIDGLAGARGLAVSPYGRFIYVAGSSDDAVSIFSCTYFDVITEEICSGQTYIMGNSTFTQTGIYTDTIAGAVGCRTITQLDLTVHSDGETLIETICSGDTYLFGGQALSSSGIYQVSSTNSAGCNITTFLDLTVTNQIQTNLTETICDGTSFQVGNNSFTTSGIYTSNLSAANGCDSMVILDLTIQANSYFIDETICTGQSFTFGNNIYTQSGTYQETFSSLTGCDSVVNLNLTVVNAFTEFVEATICTGSAYTLGSNTYTQSGSYQEMLTSSTGCDSIVTLDLTVTTTSINLWLNRSICQGEVYNFEGTNYSTSGVYTQSYATPTGCDSVITLNLFVLPNPPEDIFETICEGESYTFGSNDFAQTGTYIHIFENPNGCEQEVELHLTVKPEITSTTDKTLCAGGQYQLGNTLLTTSGTYTEQLISVAGCDSMATVNLTVLPVIENTIFKTICNGDAYILGGASYSEHGTYQQIFTSYMGCDSLVELNLTVTQINDNAITTTDNGTNSGSINLTPTNGLAPYTFMWNDGNEDEDRADLGTGYYMVTITDDNGCSSVSVHHVDFSTPVQNIELIEDFDVKIHPNPVASYTTFNLEFTIEDDRTIEIKMYDLTGTPLRTEYLDLNRGYHLHSIPSPNVEGIYFIQILSEGRQIRSLKFMVHNEN